MCQVRSFAGACFWPKKGLLIWITSCENCEADALLQAVCSSSKDDNEINLTSETFVVTFAVEAAAYPCSEVSSCL
jgi:hypothetical protein